MPRPNLGDYFDDIEQQQIRYEQEVAAASKKRPDYFAKVALHDFTPAEREMIYRSNDTDRGELVYEIASHDESLEALYDGKAFDTTPRTLAFNMPEEPSTREIVDTEPESLDDLYGQ